MSRTEPAQESSMEEILASIRRIISEDASPAKPQPSPTPTPRPTGFVPHAPSFAPAMANFPAQPVAPTPSAAKPAPSAVDSPMLLASDDDDILDLGADYAAVTRTGVLPVTGGSNGAGSLAAAITGSAIPPAQAASPDPLPQVWSPAADTRPPLWQSDPVPEAAAPHVVQPESGAIEAITTHSPPAELAPFAPEPLPPTYVAPLTLPEPPALLASLATSLEAQQPTALAGMAEALPVISTPSVEPMVEQAPFELAAAPVLEPPEAPQPVRSNMVAPAVEAAIAPAAVTAQPVRTLEDSVAELLKPMLRDWLDANMPRIVEKMARDGRS